MSFEEAFQLLATSQESAQNTIQEWVNILSRTVLTSEKTRVNSRSVDTIMKGEVSIPGNVNVSLRRLYNRDKGTFIAQKQRFIDSSLADAIYCCSGTKLLLGQHITHALTWKSLTGSNRVVILEQRNSNSACIKAVHRVKA